MYMNAIYVHLVFFHVPLDFSYGFLGNRAKPDTDIGSYHVGEPKPG